MPALPTVPNVLRCDLEWTVGSDALTRTILHFKYSGGPPTSADCVALAADVYSAVAAQASLWNETTTFSAVKLTDLSSNTGGVGIHAQSTAGTGGTELLPAGAAVLVNYQITRRYRGGKPRSYFPWGVANELTNAQTFNAGFVTAVDSALSTIFGAIIGSSSGSTNITEHVSVSYYSGFTSVENPITHRWRNVANVRTTPLVDTILSYAASPTIGSQRRRNRPG